MRGILALASLGLVGVAAAAAPSRYLVIPTSHPVDAGAVPCPPALSADGLVVAFDAHASLVAGDRNGRPDVYLLDRPSNRVTLVSRTLAGGTGRGTSRCPRISGDGQRVVFESDAPDLVEDDTPGTNDVFHFDRASGALRRIVPPASTTPMMSAGPAISADGRVVVFDAGSTEPAFDDRRRVYRAIADLGTVEDLGAGHSATVSGDGSVVAFVTSPGRGQPQFVQIVDAQGARAMPGARGPSRGDEDAFVPAVSADGRWIAFVARPRAAGSGRQQPGRAQVYVVGVDADAAHLVSRTPLGSEANGYSSAPAIDATGSRVVFASTATNIGCGARTTIRCEVDLNLLGDVFVWERMTTTLTRVNVATSELAWLEGAAHPTISADGTTVAFLSRQPVSDADGRDTFELFVTPR